MKSFIISFTGVRNCSTTASLETIVDELMKEVEQFKLK